MKVSADRKSRWGSPLSVDGQYILVYSNRSPSIPLLSLSSQCHRADHLSPFNSYDLQVTNPSCLMVRRACLPLRGDPFHKHIRTPNINLPAKATRHHPPAVLRVRAWLEEAVRFLTLGVERSWEIESMRWLVVV